MKMRGLWAQGSDKGVPSYLNAKPWETSWSAEAIQLPDKSPYSSATCQVLSKEGGSCGKWKWALEQ